MGEGEKKRSWMEDREIKIERRGDTRRAGELVEVGDTVRTKLADRRGGKEIASYSQGQNSEKRKPTAVLILLACNLTMRRKQSRWVTFIERTWY